MASDYGEKSPKDVEMNDFSPEKGRSSAVKAVPVETDGAKALYDERVDKRWKLLNRFIACCIAISLLWCTTLSICVGLVTYFIATPSYNTVYDTCKYAYDVTVEQHDSYEACTDAQLVRCNSDFFYSLNQEETRTTSAMTANSAVVNDGLEIQTTCTNAFTYVDRALLAWTANGIGFAVNYSSSCTASEIDETKKLVGDTSSVKSASYQLGSDFADTSTSRVNSLAVYADERSTYDSNYVQNKTKNLQVSVDNVVDEVSIPHAANINMYFGDMSIMVDELTACVSMDESQTCRYFPGAASLYNDIQASTNLYLDKAYDTYLQYLSEAQNYEGKVSATFDDLTKFYNSAEYTWNMIQSFIDSGVISASIGDDLKYTDWTPSVYPLSSFYAGSFDYPGTLNVPNYLGAAQTLFDPVKGAVDMALQNISVAADLTAGLGQDWYNDLQVGMDGVNFAPDDYNPPEYQGTNGQNASMEAKQQEADSEEFKGKSAVLLGSFDQLKQDQTSISLNVSLSSSDSNYQLSFFDFQFEDLSGPNFSIELWLSDLGQLGTVLFVFDYLWRVFHSIRLINQYWRKGALELPKGDIRKDRYKFSWLTMDRLQLFISIATAPAVFTCLIIALIVALIAVFISSYVPVYNTYVGACVTHTRNSTFLTSNLYSIAYNYAAEGGNQYSYDGLNDYNIQYSQYCGQYQTSSQSQQNDDELLLSSVQSVQADNVYKLGLMSKCIDSAAMDQMFQDACCGLSGYEECTGSEPAEYAGMCPRDIQTGEYYQKISPYLSIPECSNDLSSSTLTNGIFSCDALPTCDLTCTGPNEQILQSVTKQCGCTAEWGFHAGFFRLTIGVVIYLLINFSRVLFMRGLLRLNWRSLTPNVFEYVASCRRNGKFLDPSYRKPGTHYSALVKESLDDVMKSWERNGYMLILAALVINVPWAAFLNLASANVEYNPE